jgi:hypothetical protein
MMVRNCKALPKICIQLFLFSVYVLISGCCFSMLAAAQVSFNENLFSQPIVASADFNGDGKLDLVEWNNHVGLTILLSTVTVLLRPEHS